MSKYRPILLLLLLIYSTEIFSEELSIVDYNIRAFDDWEQYPANAIYYASVALDKNVKQENLEEYITSLYIKSLSYSTLDDRYNKLYNIKLAYSVATDRKVIYSDNDLYVYYANTLFDEGEVSLLSELFENEDIYLSLTANNKLIFDTISFKLDDKLGQVLDSSRFTELLEQTLEINDSLLLSELFLLEADRLRDSDKKSSGEYYFKVIELEEPRFSALAYLALGEMYQNRSYLEQSYLLSEGLSSYSVSLDILNSLVILYKDYKEYRLLYQAYEHIDYIRNRHNNFLLRQEKTLNSFNYEKDKLSNQLKLSSTKLNFMTLVVIFLGVMLILLIIYVSIQSYRLRGHNH